MYGVQWNYHTACVCMPALCNISNYIAYINISHSVKWQQ